jgi:integrase
VLQGTLPTQNSPEDRPRLRVNHAPRWIQAKGKVGFDEWAERWFATTADLKPGTRRTYRMLLDNQVLPHFGTANLAGIDTLAVREWVAGLVESGLSPSRIRNAHQVLSQVLAAAVEGGRLARNPAAGVRLPKRVEREMLFLDAGQVEQLADAIGPHYRVVVYFLAYTGLRFGEAVALKTKRLDLLRAAARWSSRQPRWVAPWCGGRPRPTSAGSYGCRGSWSSCSASTSPVDLTAPRISCSPRRWAGRCASGSSFTAS